MPEELSPLAKLMPMNLKKYIDMLIERIMQTRMSKVSPEIKITIEVLQGSATNALNKSPYGDIYNQEPLSKNGFQV